MSFAFERVPKLDVEELVLEEVPDIDYSVIGGLGNQIEAIRDAVELPFLHKELFAEHELKAPKGILLYGPPGCGKTLIAKAVANSLAQKVTEHTGQEGRSFFLNIKGPELLNKYVGETERHIRLVFQRAREKASDGMPVIVFFDEMDSLFRTRGSGVSSDVENTIVPQLLSEIDGVEGLDNVIIIGASNREDMIDPAILRPGRLDVKIKIERPDAEAAREIFSKYLTPTLPLHHEDLDEFDGDRQSTVRGMIDRTVERMYEESEENQFLEVTYAGGDKEVLYFKDFNSGAMIQNIVDRAKKTAIKDLLDTGVKGIRIGHLLQACIDEFAENEDLPNTTNPDDWAKISGKKGERIVFIRTLISSKKGNHPGRSIDTVSNTGQYSVGASLLGGALDRSFVAAIDRTEERVRFALLLHFPVAPPSAASRLFESTSARHGSAAMLRLARHIRPQLRGCCSTSEVGGGWLDRGGGAGAGAVDEADDRAPAEEEEGEDDARHEDERPGGGVAGGEAQDHADRAGCWPRPPDPGASRSGRRAGRRPARQSRWPTTAPTRNGHAVLSTPSSVFASVVAAPTEDREHGDRHDVDDERGKCLHGAEHYAARDAR